MADQNEKRQIIETQELDSQCTFTQQFYTCDDYEQDAWGQLKDQDRSTYTLTVRCTYFGRDHYPTRSMDEKSYTFDQNKMKRNVYERLSKTHFMIERNLQTDKQENYEPAVITCKGRNGLIIGKHKLTAGDKRILKDGDWILLPPGVKLFQFTYAKSAENAIENTCAIHKSFYIGEVIGKGACGEVRKVVSLTPEKPSLSFKNYAIKCVAKPKESLHNIRDEMYNSLMNEVKIMRKIDYLHVLKLFETYETIEHIILVFPFMTGGDLLNKIIKSPAKRMKEFDAKYFFLQLLNGIKYLHTKGITHRDLKPENILLSDQSDFAILSIADFGLSKMNDTMKTQCGTEYYVAPEVLRKRANYTNAVDIWSAGVVLFAMLTGKMPFSNNHFGSLRENILNCKYEWSPASIWQKIPVAQSVITLMLQLNPRNRYTAAQLVKHSWLKDPKMLNRLQEAYSMNNVSKKNDNDNMVTDAIEKTLVNVSITEDEVENPAKRVKLDKFFN